MYNGKAAEGELRQLVELSGGSHLENDLIRHNLVVFRGGENALQVRHYGCGRQAQSDNTAQNTSRQHASRQHTSRRYVAFCD